MSSLACFQFTEKGKCSFGERCKYLHIEKRKEANDEGDGTDLDDESLSDNSSCGQAPRVRSPSPTARNTFQSVNKCKPSPPSISPPMSPTAVARSSPPAVRPQSPQFPRASQIDQFFASQPQFKADPTAVPTAEFNRMCKTLGWKPSDRRTIEARSQFQDAMVLEFNDTYGTDVNDIKSWQALCKVMAIDHVLVNLEECRSVFRETHVNIVDLLHAKKTGRKVKVFETVEELAQYTRGTKKFFPRDHAKAGGVLVFLLRKILSSGRR
jgi:hypothetical protein